MTGGSAKSLPWRALFWLGILATASLGLAQDPQPSATESTESARAAIEAAGIDQLEAKKRDVEQEIARAEEAATTETAQRRGVPLTELRRRIDRLRMFESEIQRRITTIKGLQEILHSTEELEEQISTFQAKGLAEAPPYPLEFADALRDEMDTQARELEGQQLLLEGTAPALEEAKQSLLGAERAARQAKLSAEGNNDIDAAALLDWEQELSRVEERIAKAVVARRELEIEVAEQEAGLRERRLAFTKEKIGIVAPNVSFAREDLNKKLGEIEQRRDATDRKLRRATDRHEIDEARRTEARDSLSRARGDDEVALWTERLATRAAWVQTSLRTVELLEKRLQIHDVEKGFWEDRFAGMGILSDPELAEFEANLQKQFENERRDHQVQESRLIEIRAASLDLERQLAEVDFAPAIRKTMEDRVAALRERETEINEYLDQLIPVKRLAGRLLEEVKAEREHVSWSDRVGRMQSRGGTLWNRQLTKIGDEVITVRKVVLAFLILFVGWWVAAIGSVMLRRRVLPRMGVNESAAAAVAKILYYVAIVFVVLFTLQAVSIPLHLFAFLGGGIAIAIGFGAQHIANNFISGLIIMIERPIKLGDHVEVEGNHGMIEEIGARCTRIRTSANIHLLIPNSALLENTVVNWTLSDRKVRVVVEVGVAYGSPTAEVVRLLKEAARRHRKILESPAPTVLFSEFGDNSLNFEVHFWITMRTTMDRWIIESDLRLLIDKLFRKNDIVIAFPQRDVHLDSSAPLEVRVVGEEEKQGETQARSNKQS